MVVPTSLQALSRPAWRPLVIDGDSALTASKFSGQPWLAAAESYPCCANCGEPMQLFLQLNLTELPDAIAGQYGDGLLQLFYCINPEAECEVDCEAFFPFAKSVLVRVVAPESVSHPVAAVPITAPFPAKTIVGWAEHLDYPNPEEAETLGIELSDQEWDELTTEFPIAGDKLAGYPAWVQGIEYPDCPDCGQPMRLVFQLDSEDNLPFMFGDVGCGHVTQCAVHLHQVAFGWACG